MVTVSEDTLFPTLFPSRVIFSPYKMLVCMQKKPKGQAGAELNGGTNTEAKPQTLLGHRSVCGFGTLWHRKFFQLSFFLTREDWGKLKPSPEWL